MPPDLFGKPYRGWQKCRLCEWHTFRSAVCLDHGSRLGGDEFRRRPDGRTEWRLGHPGPIVPAMRKG
jgi:hypothetical protein